MSDKKGFRQELVKKAKAEKERIMGLKWEEVEKRKNGNISYIKDKIVQAMLNGETNYYYVYNREHSFTDTDLTKEHIIEYFGDFHLEFISGTHQVIISWSPDEV